MPMRPIRNQVNNVNTGVVATTLNINQIISSNSYADITAALKSCFFSSVSSNFACRIRAYNSTNARDKDFSRSSFTTPKTLGYNNHGCIFDVILGVNNESLILNFAPVPQYFGSNIYFRIENLDTVSKSFAIQINLYEV